jgi:hypothetical protein
MTLSVQFSSYVQHIENTTFPCWHQPPIFHLGINFLTVFGLTSYSGEGFPFGLKLLKKKFCSDKIVPKHKFLFKLSLVFVADIIVIVF